MVDISKKSKEETSFLDSVKINVYEFASVIITAIVAILGEKIVPTTFIGLALIVFGIVFNEYFVKKK